MDANRTESSQSRLNFRTSLILPSFHPLQVLEMPIEKNHDREK